MKNNTSNVETQMYKTMPKSIHTGNLDVAVYTNSFKTTTPQLSGFSPAGREIAGMFIKTTAYTGGVI